MAGNPQISTGKQALERAAMAGWKCDACGELITHIEDGWVEWLCSEDEAGAGRVRGIRVVHTDSASPRRSPIVSPASDPQQSSRQNRCRYEERQEFTLSRSLVEGLPLARYVGPDGLMLLLSLAAAGELPVEQAFELIKRVQVPGYEQARELFGDAIAEGILEPSIGAGYYLQTEIQAVLRWAADQAKTSKKSA